MINHSLTLNIAINLVIYGRASMIFDAFFLKKWNSSLANQRFVDNEWIIRRNVYKLSPESCYKFVDMITLWVFNKNVSEVHK